jgi:hypothetical protein
MSAHFAFLFSLQQQQQLTTAAVTEGPDEFDGVGMYCLLAACAELETMFSM